MAVLAVAALAALGCGRGSGEPARAETAGLAKERAAAAEPTAQRDALRVAFLGDSLSAGYGVAESEAFPAVVERRLREEGQAVEVLNAGVSGDTSAGGLSRLDWVLRSSPDVLVVELGANDALRGQPLAGIASNLREIVRRARGRGARVLLLGMDIPTSYGPQYSRGFTELYERVAREERVAIVPGFIREVGLDAELMQADGLHPTVAGHERLAESLLPALRTLLREG